jgi:predicted thioesterase
MQFDTTDAHLAAAFGNAGVMVVGTPALIGFLETAAAECIVSMLQPGDVSVGTSINVQHLAAAPAHAQIQALAELTERDDRKVRFLVELRWGEIVVMHGVHERRIVNLARFMSKLEKDRAR